MYTQLLRHPHILWNWDIHTYSEIEASTHYFGSQNAKMCLVIRMPGCIWMSRRMHIQFLATTVIWMIDSQYVTRCLFAKKYMDFHCWDVSVVLYVSLPSRIWGFAVVGGNLFYNPFHGSSACICMSCVSPLILGVFETHTMSFVKTDIVDTMKMS